jgi:hypothetical protein
VELNGQTAGLTVAVLTDPAGQLQQLDIGLRG